MNANDLLTVDEVAAAARVTPRTVLRWANDGRLPAVRPGSRTTRFRRADVDRLLRPKVAAVTPTADNVRYVARGYDPDAIPPEVHDNDPEAAGADDDGYRYDPDDGAASGAA